MRTSRLAVVVAVVLVGLLSIAAAAAAAPPKHAPDEVLVRFAPGVPPGMKAAIHAGVGGRRVKAFPIVPGLELMKLPAGVDVKDAIKHYRRHSDVLYAEPNYVVEALLTPPDDPYFSSLWGLNNTVTPSADIDALGAWALTTGSGSVVVTVIDTGIDYTHPDLVDNMFRNTTDCNTDLVDNDGNGYVDDCHGIDVYNNDSDPMDDNQHGTHVSGTIGAVGNNLLGVVGVNWDVQLMACKFLSSGGSGFTDGAVSCLNYVALMKDRGVNIVATNNSWGGGGYSQSLYDAIKAIGDRGVLFVAAAGNSALDNNTALFYPASYFLPNLIAVAATNETDGLAYFSNYGEQTVHLGAPGTNILSTTPGNTYTYLNGTSMATPHVTGVAALLKAQDPTRDWRAIRNLILAGGDNRSSLAQTITGKRLNAHGALACAGATVTARLRPIGASATGSAGTPVDLAALNINCASPNGTVTVTVAQGGATLATVVLQDDGTGGDLAAGDGIYAGHWTPPAPGTYTLTFPGNDVVTLYALAPYQYSLATFAWRTIAGTNLNLGDDSSLQVSPPFPIPFGGVDFSSLWVGSNGNVSFTGPFTAYANTPLPATGAASLVAPFWDDLFAVGGTDQNVFWAVTGVAPNRELVVEWRNVREYSCNGDGAATVDFQVVFFESSSDVLFNYGDTVFGGACAFADGGASATVGIQVGTDPGSATQFSFSTASLTGSTALLWTLSVPPPPPPPAIDVTPISLSFGTVTVGSSSDQKFTVQNTSGGTLTGGVSTSAPYSIVVPSGSFSLAGGASQDVWVRFAPTATGSAPGSVAFTSNAGPVTRSVSGTGGAPPVLNVSPSSVSFGRINLGTWKEQSFTVKNTGSGTLSGIASTSAPFSITAGASYNLGPGASQRVTVRFTPATPGTTSTGTVVFTSNGGNASRTVTGTTNPASITVTVPNGGESWTVNTTMAIKWRSSGLSGSVRIDLSRDGGATFGETLFATTSNDGNQTWTVTGPPTTTARVRVCDVTKAVCDTSNANFTIK